MTRTALRTRTTPRITTRTTALAAAALAGVMLLSACGDTTSSGSSNAAQPASAGQVQGDFNDADIAFVQGMKPHHEQAVVMADLVLATGPSAEVAALARQIKAAQTPEIGELKALLEAFGAKDEGDGGGHSGPSMGGMTMGGGMMTGQEMAALESATGAEATRLFLEGMVAHHKGALEMAEVELADGENPRAKDLAAKIKAAQQDEITQMQRLLQAA